MVGFLVSDIIAVDAIFACHRHEYPLLLAGIEGRKGSMRCDARCCGRKVNLTHEKSKSLLSPGMLAERDLPGEVEKLES